MADGGVCAQPRPFHILAHHEPKYTHVSPSDFELSGLVFMVCARPPSAVERMHNAVMDGMGSPCGSVEVCFCPLSPCKNARPEITPNLSGIGLRFKISHSRSPLSIRALRSARSERIRVETINF